MKKCPYCNQISLRKNGRPNGRQRYKCTNCERNMLEGAELDFRELPRKQKPTRPCKNCGKETTNPKFCSRSCAATLNNIKFPKRERKVKQRYCKHCNIEIEHRRTTCDDCNPGYVDWETRRICDIKNKAKYQVHSQIRDRARRRYRNSDRSQSCERCGYKKHIEICHIKAIADYPLETPVSEVNDLNNLVGLCPNCHWELDHGELTIEEIRSIEDDSS